MWRSETSQSHLKWQGQQIKATDSFQTIIIRSRLLIQQQDITFLLETLAQLLTQIPVNKALTPPPGCCWSPFCTLLMHLSSHLISSPHFIISLHIIISPHLIISTSHHLTSPYLILSSHPTSSSYLILPHLILSSHVVISPHLSSSSHLIILSNHFILSNLITLSHLIISFYHLVSYLISHLNLIIIIIIYLMYHHHHFV